MFNLVQEILLEPRWDAKEFVRIKQETIEMIHRNKANPNAISYDVFNRLVYGNDHIFSQPLIGTAKSVVATTLADLKDYYTRNFSPSNASIAVVGDISQDQALLTFKALEEKWAAKKVTFPDYALPEPRAKAGVYFVDVPNAKQSVIRIGNLALAYTDPDYYPAFVMNFKLGGSFNSFVNMVLREEKGYTYGARSGFSGTLIPGPFTASSSVQSKVTLESVQIFRDLMNQYRDGISPEDLAFTKNAIIKSNARRFETLGSLLSMLNIMAKYNLPTDYIKTQEQIAQAMTPAQHKELVQKYIHPERMIYLVVGDAATQMKPLEKLGFGKPIQIKY